MKYAEIRTLVNTALAGEMLSFKEMVPHLNYTIDEINSTLNTVYPEFVLEEGVIEYNHFADRWIRTVVIPGAAWHYYVSDEEGMATAPQYQADFQKGLFLMLRDTLYDIPEQYQANPLQGTTGSMYEEDRGLFVDGSYFRI